MKKHWKARGILPASRADETDLRRAEVCQDQQEGERILRALIGASVSRADEAPRVLRIRGVSPCSSSRKESMSLISRSAPRRTLVLYRPDADKQAPLQRRTYHRRQWFGYQGLHPIKGGRGVLEELLRAEERRERKRIPDIVFNVPSPLKEEFLKAYMAGDAGVTASKELSSQLLQIHSQLGHIASIFHTPPGRALMKSTGRILNGNGSHTVPSPRAGHQSNDYLALPPVANRAASQASVGTPRSQRETRQASHPGLLGKGPLFSCCAGKDCETETHAEPFGSQQRNWRRSSTWGAGEGCSGLYQG